MTKRTRVLFVGFPYIINLYQAKIATLLDISNLEVGLLCPARWKFPQWKRVFQLEKIVDGIRYYPAKYVFFSGRVGAYFYPLGVLVETIMDFRPDVIYLEQEVFSLSAFQLAWISRLYGIPLVLFCWENMDRKLSFIRRWSRSFVLHTANMITVGNQDAAKLIKSLGFIGQIEVLPQLGVDTTLFYPRHKKNEKHDFSVGFVGRLVPEKGVDLVLRAVGNLFNEGYACKVIICGSGPNEAELRLQVENLNIHDQILWLGEVRHEDIPEIISQIDVLVLPSRTVPGTWKEQFGHVLIEAMAMGVPVIGSYSGAIPEVIGRSDLIFPEGSDEALTNLIKKLMMDKAFYNEIVQYGLDRVAAHFTHAAVARRLMICFDHAFQNSNVRMPTYDP